MDLCMFITYVHLYLYTVFKRIYLLPSNASPGLEKKILAEV